MSRLFHRIMEHARSRPMAPALIEANAEVTYGQLAFLAEEQRDVLETAGLNGPAPIAILAHKCGETIAAVLECLRAGRPFLLLSPLLPAASRTALVADAGCAGILHPAERRLEALPQAAASPGIPGDTGFLLTTSGSTGKPKIVVMGHGGVDNFTEWASDAFGIRAGSRVLSLAPMNFDLSLLDIWATLASGGCVVLVPAAKAVDGGYVLAQVVEHGVEVVQGVPMFFQLLADAAPAGSAALGAGSRVRHVIFTGDDTPHRTLEGIRNLFPSATIHNVYGCTETNDSLLFTLPPEQPLPERLLSGSPVAGAEAVLVDAEDREIAGPGVGELLVSTPFVATGYLDQDLTSRKFVQHPARPGVTAFRSGDLFRRDADGVLTLLGRTDHQVKVRGVAVNTAEVERILALHQGVTTAAVVTEADPIGGRRLLAVVERAAGSSVTALDLRTHCAAHLPRTAIPALLRVTDTALPLTTTGKINRQQTQREYFPGTPATSQQGVLTP
ncbi:AMP-binding protein [Arthrobacter sp. MDT3-24]